jgi:hypothetical protein
MIQGGSWKRLKWTMEALGWRHGMALKALCHFTKSFLHKYE